jgi:acid stress-induced BolA-like protein IbaG/YrbA
MAIPEEVAMRVEDVQELITAGLPGARVEVSSADGVHFQALVVSDAFDGMRAIARHQAVYQALGESMREEIHALSLRTLTSTEAGG